MENPNELLADKLIREKAEKEAKAATAKVEKEAKKTSKKDVTEEVSAFFKQYPKAPSVLKVGSLLYLPVHQGAANEYARRMLVEVEEITNPNL